MPLTAHLYITGKVQGEIKGSCDMAGREDSILVLAFNHEVMISTSTNANYVKSSYGKRVHGPLSVVKEFDRSTPMLYQALTRGEPLKEVKLQWYAINPKGEQENFYTITLENAMIISIKSLMPHVWERELENRKPTEEVSFNYQKITWSWVADGIESEDAWLQAEPSK